jgi:hypothetical protein
VVPYPTPELRYKSQHLIARITECILPTGDERDASIEVVQVLRRFSARLRGWFAHVRSRASTFQKVVAGSDCVAGDSRYRDIDVRARVLKEFEKQCRRQRIDTYVVDRTNSLG